MTFVPSYFMAAVRRGRDHASARGHEAVFARAPAGARGLSVNSESFSCHLCISPGTSVATRSGITLVLHGELYPDSIGAPASRCLDAYMAEGMGFVARLNGSFAVVVIDTRADRVFLATDQVNSRKLLCGEHGGYTWISTALAFHLHPCSGQPDPAGIAHYLVNGVPLNNRTLISGVRVLERAAVHELKNGASSTTAYWRFDLDPRIEVPEQELRAELRDALHNAVERRLPAEGEVLLSLSAGYDATCILGLLKSLGAANVRCFSYTKQGGPQDDDAYISRQMCGQQGLPHEIVPGYGDDLPSVIEANTRQGRGLTRLIVETDAWRTIAERLETKTATVWAGDECFGFPACELHDSEQVLWSLAIGDWESLGQIRAMFPEAAGISLGDALHEDLRVLRQREAETQTLSDLREFLYLDQRLPRLLAWRETFAGHNAAVRLPFLDPEVLDVAATMPTSQRAAKRLFREVATGLFPDLYSFDRARTAGWVAGKWMRQQLRSLQRAPAHVDITTASPLDDYLPPDRLMHLMSRANPGGHLRRSAGRMVAQLRGQFTRQRATKLSEAPPRRPRVDAPTFIVRALFLREYLRQRLQA